MTAVSALAPYNTLRGLLQRLRRTFLAPGDVILALRIGWFLYRLPPHMARTALPELLDGWALSRRPRQCAAERILRLRRPWLAHVFPSHNTCYVRALCVYRFLTADARRSMRIHFGVEPGIEPGDRLRGHAWVTLDGELLEAPEPVLAGRVQEIYSHPSPGVHRSVGNYKPVTK